MSLNDLFVQILQSEQKAKERKTLLNEVKNEIVRVKEQIEEVLEECVSTQGQLVVKTQRQTEAELSVVWSRHKQAILKDQLAQVTRERDISAHELKSVEAIKTTDQEEYIQEIAGFNQTHGLCGAGREQRESEARQQLRELRKQEESLLTELSDYRQTKAKTEKLQEEKKEFKSEVKHLQGTLQGLSNRLDGKSALTKQLEMAKLEVSSKPQNDAEFLRLRSKLDVCHTEGLEAACQALQQEVDRLQRQRWQQQLQHQASQASSSTGAAVASSQQQRPTVGPKKALQKQIQPSSQSFPNQSDSVNTWSSFHITRPPQRTPSPRGNTHQPAGPPLTKPSDQTAATQSGTAFGIKKEPPFHTGGVGKPNLAKLTRRVEEKNTGELSTLGPNAKRFRFRQTFPRRQIPPAPSEPNQSTPLASALSATASNERVDIHDGGCTTKGFNQPGLSQVPGNAKKVRFK